MSPQGTTADEGFDTICYADVSFYHAESPQREQNFRPTDSKQLGTTWRHARLDGGPDLRYNSNPLIRIFEYGKFMMETSSGFRLLIMATNPDATRCLEHAVRYLSDLSPRFVIEPV